ncbi:50S ribosomal protein L7ae [archaeon]|jgi:large subunit ribosomal protein L7Ae|nr:50S ribosomal protein L7ae [archaeon]NHV06198.1 50S ribosomal protein L7ae [Nitrososphaerota archaeon]
MGKIATAEYETPEALQSQALEVLKLAAQTGKVRKGTNETTKSIERGVAKLVVIAEDVDPVEIVLHVPLLCRDRKVPYLTVSSKKTLGSAVGLSVPAACVAIENPGQAENQMNELIEKINKLKQS